MLREEGDGIYLFYLLNFCIYTNPVITISVYTTPRYIVKFAVVPVNYFNEILLQIHMKIYYCSTIIFVSPKF